MKLALDDFGTGYSASAICSASRSTRSRSTVRSSPELPTREGRNAALIRAMVGLASDLKMQTTAEGVETQEELRSSAPRLLAGPGLHLRQADAARGGARARRKGAATRPSSNSAARAAHADHPCSTASLPRAGERRAAAQHLERRSAGRMPRGASGRRRRSSSISPPEG